MPDIETPWIVVGLIITFLLAVGFVAVVFAATRTSENDEDGDGQNRGNRSWLKNKSGLNQSAPTPGARAPALGIMPDGFNGVVYRLGKIRKRRSIKPGIYFRLPNIYRITYVSVQDDVVEMPEQRVLIEDGASIAIEWALVIRVVDPPSAVLLARDYKSAVREFAQSVGAENVRSLSLEKLTSQGDSVSNDLEHKLNAQVEPYGVEIVRFAAIDFGLSDSLKQATEQVIQAQLDAKADLINAEREEGLADALLKAAEKYVGSDGAGSMSKGEIALRLRELGTFEDMRGASVLVSGEQK